MANKENTSAVNAAEENAITPEEAEAALENVELPDTEPEAAAPAEKKAAPKKTALSANKIDSAVKKTRSKGAFVGDDGSRRLQSVTETDEERQYALDLVESKVSKKILTGTLVSYQDIDGNICGVLLHGGNIVYIPFDRLFVLIPNASRTPHEQAQYQLEQSLGSLIDYIVKAYNREKKIAFADRMEAMSIKRRRFFFNVDRNNRNRVAEGDIVDSRIMSRRRDGVYVEVFGVETYIPNKELDWYFVQDAREKFENGQFIPVKIVVLTKNNKDRRIDELKVSAKEARQNPMINAMRYLRVGGKFVGEVSYISDKFGIIVMVDKAQILCPYPQYGNRPQIGSRCKIRIVTIKEEECRATGVITSVSASIGG